MKIQVDLRRIQVIQGKTGGKKNWFNGLTSKLNLKAENSRRAVICIIPADTPKEKERTQLFILRHTITASCSLVLTVMLQGLATYEIIPTLTAVFYLCIVWVER